MTQAEALITGGGGFIGFRLVRLLRQKGWRLILTVRPAHEKALRQALLEQELEAHGLGQRLAAVTLFPLDLRDDTAVRALLEDISVPVLFHLAADTRVERSLALLPPMLDLHVRAAGVMLEAALRDRPGKPALERLVWVGTCEEYGAGPSPFDETQAPVPVSPYSASRLAGTLQAHMLGRMMGYPVVCVRPFLTYGPGQHPSRFLAQAMQAALRHQRFPMTQGEQTRDLVFVDDMVEGLFRAAVAPGVAGQLLNLASGKEVTLLELAQTVFRLANADPALIVPGELPYRAGENMHFVGRAEKARAVLGWEASTPLEEGLRRTLAWERSRA